MLIVEELAVSTYVRMLKTCFSFNNLDFVDIKKHNSCILNMALGSI